ncbi:hypothetical protein A3C87_02055 [Candidatus Kaiserbacteria bacterium RIFCSPHIGHO2_02_FULL_49_34]|uniref:VTT domain-containing protein n=1 Tax=Candidatus Kaiserbacteria bacterium RIFCSPHIGHO2_02_FULL_49_34 TaxID=1798491 RepID=A0A1F6DI45_9BACT|nr:MAG: hypothetical protein A3C87_02055 [Candidatus Kaiserbacteria bacterium RIFCSPHIGHO2_02_FULL_49_34]
MRTTKHMHVLLRTILALAVVTLIAILFWASSSVQDEFLKIATYFIELAEEYPYSAIFVFMGTSVVGAFLSPFSNLPLVPFAVALWGAPATALMLLVGWVLGGCATYGIGRTLARRVVVFLVTKERFLQFQDRIAERTTFWRALTIRLVTPAELGYFFGMVRYPFGSFVMITVIAEFPYAIIATYASDAILAHERIRFFSIAGAALILALLAIITLRRRAR